MDGLCCDTAFSTQTQYQELHLLTTPLFFTPAALPCPLPHHPALHPVLLQSVSQPPSSMQLPAEHWRSWQG